MSPDLAALAERRVPRYTSYPTVPHFHAGVTGETVAAWLGALDGAAPVSLYLHVPFCREICWYCACNMRLVRREAPLLAYAGDLAREIELVAARLPGRLPVSAIHWGGGTPTALPMAVMAGLMDRIRARFAVLPGAEIAVEIDPRTFRPEMAAALAAMGVTRASLGVQELDPRVQAAVNRIQPEAVLRAAAEALRGAGIARLNLDLLYGLPHQSAETLAATIDACLALRPDRFALFGYAHVPWVARNQRLLPEAALPGPAERLAQAETAGARLEAAGYARIGLDHFALPGDPMAVAARTGRLRRNFQGYTTDAAPALLGFGATAISALPQGYAQNLPETRSWARALAEGRLPVRAGIALAPEDRLRRAVIERIMCDLAADTGALARAHGLPSDHLAGALDRLRPLAAAGLCRIREGRVQVPAAARPALRLVASAFDAYLERGGAGGPRHAVAV